MARLVYHIFDRHGYDVDILDTLVDKKIVSFYIGEDQIIVARYGVNKTTLNNILEKKTK